jgi:hypothetical protein
MGDAAREVQSLMLSGDRAGAAAAVTPELIDASCIATTPAGLDDKLAAYEAAGVDTIVAVPGGDRPATIRMLAEATSRERVG